MLEKTYFSDIPLDLQIKSWSPKPIKYNINLETKEPIRIRSKTINASLVTQLNLQYHTHPLINGQISVKSGTIKLPYSKLKIISGTLHFAAEQQLDPLLELTAKTFLQNYTITIHVTGSLKKPIINLSSVPALPEEKIAALVLTGSQQISFNIIAPGLIVEFFKKQLLEHSKQIIKKPKLNTLLKPLKHIKFTPTFTDESGRQGLYGGVEVDLGHRLHARVQKNLNLEEDTEFEINYQISDECNLQAFKNEHGNIGAQLEMHLKL